MFAVTFTGCAAGTELRPRLFNRKRSQFGAFERLLRQARDLLPGIDSPWDSQIFAILCVGQIFASLIVEYFQSQRFEPILQWLIEKSKYLSFKRLTHSPIILTRTRFRRLPSNSPSKDLFPGSKIEFSFGDSYHDLTTHDSAFKVSVRIVLGSVGLVLEVGVFRCRFFQPMLN